MEFIWLPDDFPLEYWVADDGSANSEEACEASGGLHGCCEETVPAGYCTTVSAEGFDAWHAAECAEFEVEYQDVSPNIGSAVDGRYQITFNDPANQNDLGTLAVTYSVKGQTVFSLDGVNYGHFESTDIVFSKDQEFATNEDVAAGDCNQASNIRGVMTHEIGHSLGMDHSCEDPNKPEQGGGPCPDPTLLAATMYWSEGPCETEAIDINEDDIEGFNALYGPYATFTCSHQVSDDLSIGVVPFDLKCVVVSDSLGEVDSASWNFGDGGTSTDINATHTYTEPGNYTIQLTVHGEREQCGADGWENNYRKVGYVRACGEPVPAFAVEHSDGLKYRMLNDSDVSVYGCLSNIQWDVFKGDSTSGEPIESLSGITAWEPIIEFPEPGTYTVVMNLGGIGGTGAAKVTFEAKNFRGEGRGCSTVDGVGAGVGLLALLGLAARRRR
ncbi:MAG: PKD domain-containing protein [Myxococcota bacterium]